MLMLAAALVTAVLTIISFTHGTLYTPFGAMTEPESGVSFYMGIAVYITISATLFTSVVIRIALGITK